MWEWEWEVGAQGQLPMGLTGVLGSEATVATSRPRASMWSLGVPVLSWALPSPPAFSRLQASTHATSSPSTSLPSRRCVCWTPPWSFWRWLVSPFAAT